MKRNMAYFGEDGWENELNARKAPTGSPRTLGSWVPSRTPVLEALLTTSLLSDFSECNGARGASSLLKGLRIKGRGRK